MEISSCSSFAWLKIRPPLSPPAPPPATITPPPLQLRLLAVQEEQRAQQAQEEYGPVFLLPLSRGVPASSLVHRLQHLPAHTETGHRCRSFLISLLLIVLNQLQCLLLSILALLQVTHPP